MPDWTFLLEFAIALIGGWYTLTTVIVGQFKKSLDVRFDAMTTHHSELHAALKTHMEEEGEILRDLRRLEAEIERQRAEVAERYVTRVEANNRHSEIISAIQSVGMRIDQLLVARLPSPQ
jgi:chromosome segregation ATPase